MKLSARAVLVARRTPLWYNISVNKLGQPALKNREGRGCGFWGLTPDMPSSDMAWWIIRRARFAPVEYGAITTPAHTLFEERLVTVYEEMKELLSRTCPQALAIETLFYAHNQSTVIYVAEARGVILLAARQAGVPVFEYTPLQVKQAVAGYGKAVKSRCRR